MRETDCDTLGSPEPFFRFSAQRLWRDLEGRGFVARIPANDLNCVFYLYPDEASAKSGEKLGGSGFWVAIDSPNVPNHHWLFGVSNKHVVHKISATVIRANARSSGIFTYPTEPTDWIEHPGGHDIAILVVGYANIVPHIELVTIPQEMFVIEQHVQDETVGLGDDVYMIGRFVNHEGRQRNIPSVRFGNISMLPGEPIYIDAKTRAQESFAVELRSMCGYSGSPVFVEVGGVQRRHGGTSMGPPRQLFLGVHWGHILEPWTVEKYIQPARTTALRPGEKEIELVQANTGMNGVVPAWRLREMFNLPAIRDALRRDEEAELERRKRENPGAKLDAAVVAQRPPDDDANPNHLADFTRLVDVAARKKPKD